MRLSKPQAKKVLFNKRPLVLNIINTDCYLEVQLIKPGITKTKTEYFNMLLNRFLRMAEDNLDTLLAEKDVVYYDRVEERLR